MLPNILLLLFVLVICFIFAEILSSFFLGDRLIVTVEDNGLYHFEPNQEGWYDIKYPKARINNIGARGDDVNINLLGNKYIFLVILLFLDGV